MLASSKSPVAADAGGGSRSADSGSPYDRPHLVADNPYEIVGLNPRDVWVLTGAMLFISGVVGVFAWLLNQDLSDVILVVAVGSIGLAPLMVVGARRFPDVWWGTHVRMTVVIILLTIDGFALGDARTSGLPWVLGPLVSVGYLQRSRTSAPYIVFVLFNTAAITLMTNERSIEMRTLMSVTVFALICIAVVVSQQLLRSVAMATRRRSLTDPLTGLANTRFLRSRIEQELNRGRREGLWPALLHIDLDDFKRVNDELSHSVGDAMLKAVGDAVRSEVEPIDLVARRGGDEFSAVITAAADRDLDGLSKRILIGLRLARSKVHGPDTGGGGVGYVIANQDDDVDSLIRRADAALLEAKRRGRAGKPNSRTGDGGTSAEPTPVETEAEIETERRIKRIAEFALGTQIGWTALAASTSLVTIALVAGALIGWAPDLNNARFFAVAAVSISLSAIFLIGSRRRWGENPLKLSLIATLGLIVASSAIAGPSRQAIADVYMLICTAALFFFSLRAALPIALAAFCAFSVSLITSDYEYTALRIAFTAVPLAYVITDIARARGMTRAYTLGNIELSSMDSLTGVANLRGLRLRLADLIDATPEDGRSLALLSIDLDEFKKVNDGYGHTEGDAMLAATARALSESVREGDLVARRGGDEFSVICDDITGKAVEELIERIASAVRATRLRRCPDLNPSVSVGYAFLRENETVGALMARADRRLHDAKAAARRKQDLATA